MYTEVGDSTCELAARYGLGATLFLPYIPQTLDTRGVRLASCKEERGSGSAIRCYLGLVLAM